MDELWDYQTCFYIFVSCLTHLDCRLLIGEITNGRQEIPDSKPQLKLLFKNSSANFSNKIIRFRYLPANSSSKYKRPKFISTQILGALRLQGLVYPYSQDTAGLNITM